MEHRKPIVDSLLPCARRRVLPGSQQRGVILCIGHKLTGEDFENAVAALTDAEREAYERRG